MAVFPANRSVQRNTRDQFLTAVTDDVDMVLLLNLTEIIFFKFSTSYDAQLLTTFVFSHSVLGSLYTLYSVLMSSLKFALLNPVNYKYRRWL